MQRIAQQGRLRSEARISCEGRPGYCPRGRAGWCGLGVAALCLWGGVAHAVLVPQLVRELSGSDTAAGDQFGTGGAIDGDLLVVGARYHSHESGPDAGAAYVFERDSGDPTQWLEVAELVPPDGASNDCFGCFISMSGNTVVVSAQNHSHLGTGTARGAVYVFERNQGGLGQWGLVKEISPSDGADFDRFGTDVALDGDTLIVGSRWFDVPLPPPDPPVANSGAVYVYERNAGGAGNWGQVQRVDNPDPADGDQFGFSVSLAGDTAAIGAYLDDEAAVDWGAAYVYERNPGNPNEWLFRAKLMPGDAGSGGVPITFGKDVYTDGNLVVVGANQDSLGLGGTGTNAGSAYVFERDSGNPLQWNDVTKLIASNAAAHRGYGAPVWVSGDRIIVGAPSGSAVSETPQFYVYERNDSCPTSWTEVARIEGEIGSEFASLVRASSSTLLVGAHTLEGDPGVESGLARVYELPSTLLCGNEAVDCGETCDDGNANDGDGCSSTCQCEGTCGDGLTNPACGETCDDGNVTPGDGCDETCQVETARCCTNVGVTCNADNACPAGDTCCTGRCCDDVGIRCADDAVCSPGACCAPTCGDGVRDPGEDCDLGADNGVPGSGCSVACVKTGICLPSTDECTSQGDCSGGEPCCGDGVLDPGEACDDGNLVDGDCCSATCTVPGSCVPACEDVFGPRLLTATMKVKLKDRDHDGTIENWLAGKVGALGDFNLAPGQSVDPCTEELRLVFLENDGSDGRRILGDFRLDPGTIEQQGAWKKCRVSPVGSDDELAVAVDQTEQISVPAGVRKAKIRERANKVKYKFKGSHEAAILYPTQSQIRVCVYIGDDAGTAVLDCQVNGSGTAFRCTSTN